MKNYAPNTFDANRAQKEAHDLRMEQNRQRRALLRRRAEELEEELTRVMLEIKTNKLEIKTNKLEIKTNKLEIKTNKLEGAAMHNEQVFILRLPVEITAYIFEVARGQTRFDDSAQDGPWKSIKERPEIVISHVCRSWRSISLAHPALWSHFLHIHDEDSGIPVPLKWMSVYLERSKKMPLDIILDLTCVPEEHDNCYAYKVLDLLIPHAARWRRLSMYVSYDDWDAYVAPSPFRMLSAPSLEVFEMTCLDHTFHNVEDVHPIFLGGVPNLVSVRMESFGCKTLIPSSSTITTLHLNGNSEMVASREPWDNFLLIMAIPTLVNLTMEGACFEEPRNVASSPRIVALSLRSLRLNACNEIADYIWNFVAAPQLELLAFFNTRRPSNSILELYDLSPSSFASLKTLILFKCNLGTMFLFVLSRITQGLIHLILDADHSMKTYVDRMVRRGQSSVFWPNLETLTCVSKGLKSDDLARLNLTDYAKVINWQSGISGKPCVLRVDQNIANYWISQSPSKELWEYLLETGVVAIANEDGPYSSVIPWPHHASGHFRVAQSAFETDI